jgi:hypothetical protein
MTYSLFSGLTTVFPPNISRSSSRIERTVKSAPAS